MIKMILTEDEKVLYDSCGSYAKRFLLENGIYEIHIDCVGDDNILELCNRCPYYTLLTDHSVDPIAK